MGWMKPVSLLAAGPAIKRCCNVRKLKRFVPIVNWLPNYRLSYVKNDLIAGLTVGLTLVAQALAFAQIANLPPEYGLYSGFIGLFVYTLFGTSKDAGLGPSNLLSMLVGQFMLNIHSHNPVYTTLMSLFCGVALFLMGVLRLGFLVNMFSIPVISGFTSAAGLIIIINQLANFFGIVGREETSFKQLSHFFKNFTKMNFIDLAVGGIGLVFLIILQRLPNFCSKRFIKFHHGSRAAEILRVVCASRNVTLVVVGTLFSYLLNVVHPTVVIHRIGKLPGGLPVPSLPRFSISNDTVYQMMPNGTVVASAFRSRTASEIVFDDLNVSLFIVPLMVMLELLAITKALGRKNHYKVDHSQELIAVGLANIAGSFFQAFPITAAATRSALNDQCRVSTPLAGAIAAVIVIIAAQFATPIFFFIPKSVLAAVIMSAGISLIDLATIAHIWHEWRWDLIPLAATFFVSVTTNMWQGILVGISISLAMLLAPVVRLKVVTEHLTSGPSDQPAKTPAKSGAPPPPPPPSSANSKNGSITRNGSTGNANASISTPFQTPPSLDDAAAPSPVQRVTIVRLQQGLQYPSVDRFTDRMAKILAKDAGQIVIDCQFITGLDFTSLQGIRQVLLLACRLNRSVVFARLSDHLRKHIERLDIDHFRHVSRWDDIMLEDKEDSDEFDNDASLSSLNGSAYGDHNVEAMLAKRSGKNIEDLTPIPEEVSDHSIEAVITTVATSPNGSVAIPHRHSVPNGMNGNSSAPNMVAVDHHVHKTQSNKPNAATLTDLAAAAQLAYEPHFFGSAIPLAVGSVSLEDIAGVTAPRVGGGVSHQRTTSPQHVSNHTADSYDNFLRMNNARHVSFMISDYEDDNDDSDSDEDNRVTMGNSRRRLQNKHQQSEHVELLEFTTKPSKHGHAATTPSGEQGSGLRMSLRKPNSADSKRVLVATASHPHLTLENEVTNVDSWPADALLSNVARSLSHQNTANSSSEDVQGSGKKGGSAVTTPQQHHRLSPNNNSKDKAATPDGALTVVVVHSSTEDNSRVDRDKID